jgi:hypothetical protein
LGVGVGLGVQSDGGCHRLLVVLVKGRLALVRVRVRVRVRGSGGRGGGRGGGLDSPGGMAGTAEEGRQVAG